MTFSRGVSENRRTVRFICLVIVAVVSGGPICAEEPTEAEIGPVQVLQSERDALAEIFPDADSAVADTIRTDSEMVAAVKSLVGWAIADSVFVCYSAFDDGYRLGMAIVSEERGKYRPITFMAGMDTLGRLVDVRVLVYRESRGGEIRRPRFLKQYRHKTLDDPIRINRDIINITGATISVNALNAGVRKVLAVVDHLRTTRQAQVAP